MGQGFRGKRSKREKEEEKVGRGVRRGVVLPAGGKGNGMSERGQGYRGGERKGNQGKDMQDGPVCKNLTSASPPGNQPTRVRTFTFGKTQCHHTLCGLTRLLV